MGDAASGDFISHSSYRVTADAVPMGEAAGKVAALAAKSNRLPHEVLWPEMRLTANKPEACDGLAPISPMRIGPSIEDDRS